MTLEGDEGGVHPNQRGLIARTTHSELDMITFGTRKNSSRRLLNLGVSGMVVAVLASFAAADTHHVPLGGDIQAALDEAQPGDTVLLEPGTYEVGTIRLRDEVELRGADPGNGLTSEPLTTLSSNGPGRVLECWPNYISIIVRDLKIVNTNGVGLASDNGSSGVVSNCWFLDSKAATTLIKGTWTFDDCVFSGNGPGGNLPGAGSCGAVGLHIGPTAGTQQVTFTRCVFEDNTSAYSGGAIRSLWGGLVIEECIFRRNRATIGSAISFSQTMQPVEIRNSLFEHNSSDGGTIDTGPNLGRVILNCQFRSNYGANGRADISGPVYPEACTFNACCTVDPNAAAGHGNVWEHPGGETTYAMCPMCRCDFNCNGSVGPEDLGALLGAWGSTDSRFDLDEDGTIDPPDLGNLLASWGTCP